jgi:hypothetical protein
MLFAAVQKSAGGPKRRFVQLGDMSGVGGEPDSTSTASIGQYY